jgi:hypothetical protein
VRWPDEDASVARSQLFILEEGLDYTVDEGQAAVLTEQKFEHLVAAAVGAAEPGDFQIDAVNHQLREQALDPALLSGDPRPGDELGDRDGRNGGPGARPLDASTASDRPRR